MIQYSENVSFISIKPSELATSLTTSGISRGDIVSPNTNVLPYIDAVKNSNGTFRVKFHFANLLAGDLWLISPLHSITDVSYASA